MFGVWRACELAVMRVSQYTVISCKYVRSGITYYGNHSEKRNKRLYSIQTKKYILKTAAGTGEQVVAKESQTQFLRTFFQWI